MMVSDITIYDALKGILGEEKARQVVTGIKEQVAYEVEVQKSDLATKGDVLALKDDIAKFNTKISEVKYEMIKWMFIFWLGAVGALAGIMFVLINAKMK